MLKGTIDDAITFIGTPVSNSKKINIYFKAEKKLRLKLF